MPTWPSGWPGGAALPHTFRFEGPDGAVLTRNSTSPNGDGSGLSWTDLGLYQLRSEKGSPNGYASLDSSGLVPVGQLPVGVLNIRASSDQGTSSTTLQSHSTLAFPVSNALTYRFRFMILWQSSGFGVGFALQTPTFSRFAARTSISGVGADGIGTAEYVGANTASDDAVVSGGPVSASTDYVALVEGVITPSANGTLTLRFKSASAGNTATIRSGSNVEYFQI